MTEGDRLCNKIGMGARIGFGKSPAIIVIDFMCGATDPAVSSLGFNQDEELAQTQRLLEAARKVKVPIFYTIVAYQEDYADAGIFVKKIPALKALQYGSKASEVDDRVRPEKGEHVIVKKYASCFFGTSLFSTLNALGVDTTILTGNSTSGCIRATAVDSCSLGFHTIVPKECVADRVQQIHESNLFDIDSKYADVVSIEDILSYFKNLQ